MRAFKSRRTHLPAMVVRYENPFLTDWLIVVKVIGCALIVYFIGKSFIYWYTHKIQKERPIVSSSADAEIKKLIEKERKEAQKMTVKPEKKQESEPKPLLQKVPTEKKFRKPIQKPKIEVY